MQKKKIYIYIYTHQSVILQKGPHKLFAAPLGGFLGNWISCRVTIILGGLLSSAGLILSSFASSLEQLYICMGVFTGNILPRCSLIMNMCHFCLFV